MDWDPSVVVPLHYFKEVDSEDLEDHYEVLAVWPTVHEGVQELDAMAVLACNGIFRQVSLRIVP